MNRTYVVKELDETANIYKMGLRWGVYMLMLIETVSPVAMGFFYDKPVAVAVCAVMNDGGWKFKLESAS